MTRLERRRRQTLLLGFRSLHPTTRANGYGTWILDAKTHRFHDRLRSFIKRAAGKALLLERYEGKRYLFR